MKQLFYLGYYDTPEGKTSIVLSAVNKMNYIMSAMRGLDYQIEIISASSSFSHDTVKRETRELADGMRLTTFTSLPSGNILRRIIRRFYLKAQLKNYLFRHLKKDDILFIYHSLGYHKLYSLLKKRIGCKIILEVEEIYTDVGKNIWSTKVGEHRPLRYADAYIFPTLLLYDAINTKS